MPGYCSASSCRGVNDPYTDPQLISVLTFLSCPHVIWSWAQRLSSRDQLSSLLWLRGILYFFIYIFRIFLQWICILIAIKQIKWLPCSFGANSQVRPSALSITLTPTRPAYTGPARSPTSAADVGNQSHAFAWCTSSSESFSTQLHWQPLLIYQSCERKPVCHPRMWQRFTLPSGSIIGENFWRRQSRVAERALHVEPDTPESRSGSAILY